MTVYSRFHDNVAYTDVQWAETFNSVHLDGVDAGLYNGLKVYANTPNAMNVLVPTGRAWVQGRWYYSDAVQTMTIEAAAVASKPCLSFTLAPPLGCCQCSPLQVSGQA